jgi:hypothetical protein
MAAKVATAVLLLSAAAYMWALGANVDWLATAALLLGSFASGLLYAYTWGWKGLLMAFVVAFVFGAAGIGAILFLWHPAGASGLAGLLAAVAAVAGVVMLGGVSLVSALVGGVIGAVLHRRRELYV